MHLGLQLYSKETPTQAFSSEICNNFWNSYFEEHLWTMASECYYNGGKILRNTSTSCRISHSGGGMGGRGRSTPPFYDFFEPLPIKTDPPHGAHPPLKNEGGGGGGGTALSCEDWNKENIFLPLIWKVQTIWLWVILGSWWWFWVVLAGCGWFWVVACFITNVHFLKCLNQLCWSPNKGWSIIGPYQVSIPSLTSKWKNNYLMSNTPQCVWLC